MSKMKERFGVGWWPKSAASMKHFFVGELPICGAKITPNKTAVGSQCCKRCILSLEAALDKSR